jgi:hypothetical protein
VLVAAVSRWSFVFAASSMRQGMRLDAMLPMTLPAVRVPVVCGPPLKGLSQQSSKQAGTSRLNQSREDSEFL